MWKFSTAKISLSMTLESLLTLSVAGASVRSSSSRWSETKAIFFLSVHIMTSLVSWFLCPNTKAIQFTRRSRVVIKALVFLIFQHQSENSCKFLGLERKLVKLKYEAMHEFSCLCMCLWAQKISFFQISKSCIICWLRVVWCEVGRAECCCYFWIFSNLQSNLQITFKLVIMME